MLDRFIQQAILQVLQPRFDPTFSTHSYGFRPGRSAHQAVLAAHRYFQEGYAFVVDLDLSKFFDRVNHDVLMGRLAKRIADKRLLKLVRSYLEAGVMVHGVVVEMYEGVPQGGPLSPLLSNVLLDEVDKELERRGHAFVRYADDCNVYVRSKQAGERVKRSLVRLYEHLHLQVNEDKSAVDRPYGRSFLGFSFYASSGGPKRKVAPKALHKMKERVRAITRRTGGRSVPQVVEELTAYLRGWKAYFRLTQTPRIFRSLEEWIRHRLRMLHLRQWKRGPTTYRELVSRGLPPKDAVKLAGHHRGWWRRSQGDLIGRALPTSYFDKLGLCRLTS